MVWTLGLVTLEHEYDDPPFVDEHQIQIPASRDQVWSALRRYAESLGIGERNPLARLWGAEPRTGFEVAREVPNQQLGLAGRHRFSRYLLVFELGDLPGEETLLTAKTYAEFPGLHGSAYRALVIGTRFHVLAVRRMLSSIRSSSLA